MLARSKGLHLLVSGLMALPSAVTPALALELAPTGRGSEQPAALVARGGGGLRSGGLGGGGGSRPAAGHSGFKNAGPGLGRGSTTPGGGWSNRSQGGGGPSLERPRASSQPRGGSGERQAIRSDNRSDNLGQRSEVRNNRIDQRGEVRTTRIENRSDRVSDRSRVRRDRVDSRGRNVWTTYPGWARPGWGPARPWNTGWYGGWSSPSWSWWGGRAAAWGIASLTTAAMINAAVNDAVNNQLSYIMVPNSSYELMYGTITPVGSDAVRFEVYIGDTLLNMQADCRRGTLNGSTPNSVAEAELLNAACQVAYGSV